MQTRVVVVLSLCLAAAGGAQDVSWRAVPLHVGSEWERYARSVQLSGNNGLPWSVRPFGPQQWKTLLPRDTMLPWKIGALATNEGQEFFIFPPAASVVFNGGFPHGYNDGAIWSGRGATVSASVGVFFARGPLAISFAPIAFAAQNASFALRPNGHGGALSYANWRSADYIDLPQRFGNEPYVRFDGGQSEARVDLKGIALGVSTANQFWGPAQEHPIILGNNAAGIPRVFLGTSRPANLSRVGRFHGQAFWGTAGESPYSPTADSRSRRMVSGIIGVYQPAFIQSLELGATRFFHVLKPTFGFGLRDLARPLSLTTIAEQDNQLASIFFRYAAVGDGLEFYGEFGREDHANSLREFLLIPDHVSAYVVGFAKAWRQAHRIVAVRAEVLNSHITQLGLSSQQSPWYVHYRVRQGHTILGQSLGSAAGHGGGASLIAVDRYDARGRISVRWERLQLAEAADIGESPDVFQNQVRQVLGVDALRFRDQLDIGGGLSLVHELNRFPGVDELSLQIKLTVGVASPRRRTQ
jgi:hypothetical protein